MKISDLFETRAKGVFKDDRPLKGDIVAMDGRDGKVLFDTRRNKNEHIAQFMQGEVISLWADMVIHKSVFGDYCKAIMKCYVSHDSWKGEMQICPECGLDVHSGYKFKTCPRCGAKMEGESE